MYSNTLSYGINHPVVSLTVAFSMILRNNLIEFPCADIATLTWFFFISFFRSLINDFTLFSTSANDSPFGAETL